MRVMLDSVVWTELARDEQLRKDFREVYESTDLEIIFSVGNFLELAHRDDHDKLTRVIDEFTTEYIGPLQLDFEGEYRYSSKPLLLATIDAEWFEHCRRETMDLDERETLNVLFQDAEVDDGPMLSSISQFVSEYSDIDEMELQERVDIPRETSRKVAVKKIRTFPRYVKKDDDGTIVVADEEVPKKRYVVGMSMIYISETRDEPEVREYWDAMVWAQAIICGCEILWTTSQWKHDHPILSQVRERVDRKELELVTDLNELGAKVT